MRSHCEPIAPIVPEYTGDMDQSISSFVVVDFDIQMATLLPIFKNLREVRVWSSGHESKELTVDTCIAMSELSQQRKFPDEELKELVGTWPFQGEVRIKRLDTSCISIAFGGLESMINDRELSLLKSSEDWPSNNYMGEMGENISGKVEAVPHAGAYIARIPRKGKGRIFHQTLVFLPAGRPDQILPCPGGYDYSLMLHGYFFLDAGRKNIVGGDQNREPVGRVSRLQALQTKWNNRLLQCGTYPLIPGALKRLVDLSKMDKEATRLFVVSNYCLVQQWVLPTYSACCESADMVFSTFRSRNLSLAN